MPQPSVAPWWAPSNWPWWLITVGALTLLALAGFLWSAADMWRLRRLEPAATMATLYQRVRRQGQRLAVPIRVSDTPYEFAASFAGWAADVAQENWWGDWLTPATNDVRSLVDLLVQANYGPLPIQSPDQHRAVQVWSRLHRHLWATRVRRWLTERGWL
jgi:hypothetical protein